MSETYGEVHARMQRELAAATLADPGGHFPYKVADAKTALKRKNMGPDADQHHDVTGADYLSARIIDASEAYIAAQAEYLRNPSPGTLSSYEAATDDLVAARRVHRRGRVDEDGNPVAGVVGTTRSIRPGHMSGVRLRRVGEE